MQRVIGRVWRQTDGALWWELRTVREGANPYAKQSWTQPVPRLWWLLARVVMSVG